MSFTVNLNLIGAIYNENNQPEQVEDYLKAFPLLTNISVEFVKEGKDPIVPLEKFKDMRVSAKWEKGCTPLIIIQVPKNYICSMRQGGNLHLENLEGTERLWMLKSDKKIDIPRQIKSETFNGSKRIESDENDLFKIPIANASHTNPIFLNLLLPFQISEVGKQEKDKHQASKSVEGFRVRFEEETM